MTALHKKPPPIHEVHVDEEVHLGWLDLALIVGILTLSSAVFFLFFPGTWTTVVSLFALILSYVDVRDWTWRSYAVISVIAIGALTIAKSRQDIA